jgi:hypothetical protein
VAPAAVVAAFWLWFLARGRAPAGVKRLALRATLLGLAFALVGSAARRGLLTQASFGFRVALVLAVVLVAVGYLYLTRFCGRCGRMVRNLRLPACPRCGAPLPAHGMTTRLARAADPASVPEDRRARTRRRHPEGPSA